MSAAYIVAKQLFVTIFIVTAFSFFADRVRRLLAIMRNVKGTTPVPLPNLAEHGGVAKRTRILFSDVLGQANVRRKPGVGFAHMAIFFGFLLIQPHSLELMIRGVIPSFSFHAFAPELYTGFMAVADVAGFLCLLGFCYILYRRLVEKPPYLPQGRDAFLVVLFTMTIVVTFHVVNALETVSLYAANGSLLTGVPVSSALAAAAGMAAWPASVQNVVFEVVYWLHLGVILCFLVYIPGSKHLHLLAAAPNAFLKPLRVEKSIAKTDVEDENAETFGLGFINEISWKQVLDLYSCTECGRCEEQCPAAQTGKALSPRQFVHDLKTELFENSEAILRKTEEESSVPPIVRPDGRVLPEQVWDCTTCRACEEACPVNIQHLDFMIEIRKHQALMEASFPQELGDAFSNIENQSNPWGLPSAKRGDWAKELGVPHIADMPDAEIVYFAGSALSLEDRGKQVSIALMKTLRHAGVKVAHLGADEHDAGDDARRAGNEYLAQSVVAANVAMLAEYGATTLLTACPHTYNMLKNEYPQFGGDYTVFHHSEYLDSLLASGRLTLPPADDATGATATYHDSCYLGRWNAIFEAPRNVLRRALGASALVEMRAAHEKNLCCGGGGGRMFMEENTGERINHVRTRQAVATGAQTIVSACPYCLTMLSDGVKELGVDLRVKDIAEIVLERIGGAAAS